MENEQFLDRAMRPLRPVFVGLLILTLPVFMFTYGWGLKMILAETPRWVFLLVCLSNAIAWLGIASLIDIRQGHQTPRDSGQGASPRRP
jgi:hypothetical protein